jgi:hypothetical protein
MRLAFLALKTYEDDIAMIWKIQLDASIGSVITYTKI